MFPRSCRASRASTSPPAGTGAGGTVDSEAQLGGVVFDLTGASPGVWVVQVKNSDGGMGSFGDGASSGFHVVGAAPTVSGISPSTVAQGTSQEITITGTNLAKGIKVVFLDKDDLQSGGRSVQGGRVAARAAAEDDDVGVRSVAHARATSRRVAAICSGCGMPAASSGGAVGGGVFLAAIRRTGWSSHQKHSSWTTAVTSAP